MCTLSRIRLLDGYHVFFNRDERRKAVHASHEPERGPLSVCMHRPEAETVSFTRIDVSPGQVVMTCIPGVPRDTTDRIVATLDQ